MTKLSAFHLILILALATACTSPDPEFDGAYPGGPYDLSQRVAALERQKDENNETRNELAQLRVQINALQAQQRTYDDICERSPGIQEEFIDILQLPSCEYITSRELLRITELTFSGDELWPGDLDGLRNVETLRLYLQSRPPEDLLENVPAIKELTLDFRGICTEFAVNGKPLEVFNYQGDSGVQECTVQ